jgi:hypothetical protein
MYLEKVGTGQTEIQRETPDSWGLGRGRYGKRNKHRERRSKSLD